MLITGFINLTGEEQTYLFYEVGLHSDTLQTFDAKYKLYSVYSFYVELTLKPDGRQIQRFSTFNSGKRLDEYPTNLTKSPKPWG